MPHIFFFLAAALLLAVTPGPGMFYVVGRTWAAGRRLARERRPDGSPPIAVVSDGTVF